MSLLIKALHKAEKEKASEGKSTSSAAGASFELAPKEMDLTAEAGLHSAEPVKSERPASSSGTQNQKAAGVIFSAKSAREDSSTRTLVLTGIILLIVIAAAFYYYLESLKQPELVMPAPVSPVVSTIEPSAAPEVAEVTPDVPDALDQNETAINSTSAEINDPQDEKEMAPINEGFTLAAKANTPSAPAVYGQPVTNTEDARVKVTRNDPPPAINPNLTVAYDAFNAGDDATAQSYYRKVLQADMRNTDALLGMAAVALRQGRGNDALGWYGKVLEVEPRNSFAQAAMASVLSDVDPTSSESRIKNLIALQPGASHLHAALGSLYAGRSQWAQAQHAYFEAHRLDAANAEHVFNLAVSLDQLGKPSLALQYYRQALGLLGGDSAAAIDRAALESRIAQLQ